MKRLITLLLATAAMFLALAVPSFAAPSGHRVHSGVSFTLQTLNGNQNCITFSPAIVGTRVKQAGGPFPFTCRRWFFQREGVVNGFNYGEWEDSFGHALASPSCGHAVTIEDAHSTGSVWVNWTLGVQPFMVNRHCDDGDCHSVLSADNVVGHNWFVIKRGSPGYEQIMHMIRNNSGVTGHRRCCVCR